jgi:hypothetical protein
MKKFIIFTSFILFNASNAFGVTEFSDDCQKWSTKALTPENWHYLRNSGEINYFDNKNELIIARISQPTIFFRKNGIPFSVDAKGISFKKSSKTDKTKLVDLLSAQADGTDSWFLMKNGEVVFYTPSPAERKNKTKFVMCRTIHKKGCFANTSASGLSNHPLQIDDYKSLPSLKTFKELLKTTCDALQGTDYQTVFQDVSKKCKVTMPETLSKGSLSKTCKNITENILPMMKWE